MYWQNRACHQCPGGCSRLHGGGAICRLGLAHSSQRNRLFIQLQVQAIHAAGDACYQDQAVLVAIRRWQGVEYSEARRLRRVAVECALRTHL